METEKFLRCSENLENLVHRYSDVLTEKLLRKAQNNSSIKRPHEYKEDIELLDKDGRQLNIGIIGRVKAGKSSLLNSLFFEGEAVLPKAATPMTAALTSISYNDNFEARVELFNEADIRYIEKGAQKYKKRLNKTENNLKLEFIQKKQRKVSEGEYKLTPEDERKIVRRAVNSISNEIELEAAYKQWKHLEQSVRPESFESETKITGSSIDDLKDNLADYVSVDGSYTAYTKAVELMLPLDSLKGISVVDTPGINDPIVSREQRTLDFLSKCDVVFVLSPSSQFFDTNDQKLLTRLTNKEALKKIYFVATQVDNALNGPEYSGQPMALSLSKLNDELQRRLQDEISKLKDTVPLYKDIFNEMPSVLSCSAISSSISKKLSRDQELTIEEHHALEQMSLCFHDDFSSNQLDSLNTLSGINNLEFALSEVRKDKAQIMESAKSSKIKQYLNNLNDYQKQLFQLAENRKEQIEHTDLVGAKKELENYTLVKRRLNNGLREQVIQAKNDYDSKFDLSSFIRNEFSLDDDIRHLLHKEEKKKEVKILYVINSEETEIVDALNTTNVRRLLNKEIGGALDQIGIKLNEIKRKFSDEITNNFINKFKESFALDKSEALFENTKSLVLDLKEELSNVKFDTAFSLPSKLAPVNTLYEEQAKDYCDNACEFLSTITEQAKRKTKSYKESVFNVVPDNLAEHFYQGLQDEVSKKEDDIKNKKLKIYQLNKFIDELQDIQHG